ncbi:DUF4406 domain-containing protein [Aeromonas caviae]|uniref:DUF4406 domain-containing protein n=1 Tax=Aeromonas caviae TaxID=648 RepID=UPI0005F071FA|nr:DUF4406 domain-containing protein [Aeromonas caviae]ATP90364.1 DUF4406 domain-containing protein [Aeromonas caviae]
MSNQHHQKRIYIAGPMSGLPDCNRPAFHAEANHQRERGHIPLNPATLPDGLSQAEYMACCLPMVMLAGWRDSQGATAEFHLAMKCGKVIRQAEDGFAWYPTSPEVAA